jgi:uncharacterized membrane protein
MEAFLGLLIFIGLIFVLDTRSRAKGLERRLGLVENELRRRIAMGVEVLPTQPAAPTDAAAMPVEARPEPIAKAAAPEPVVTAIPPEREPQSAAENPPMEVESVSETASSPAQGSRSAAERDPAEVQPGLTQSPLSAESEASVAPAPIPLAPTQPQPAFAFNFEELFGRKLPIWAGGITLAIAGVLIVKYAIDIGLFARIFTPGVQVLCGLLFGFGLIGGAELAHRKRDKVDDPRVAQALAGAGVSTLYAALLVAANAYQIISPLTAFIGLALVTLVALGLSLRHGAASALLGLAGGLAAPALTVGITANVPMLAIYLAFTIAGLVGVSRAQRWPWLALIALVGGAGWSLWLIIAGEALGVIGGLSIGSFVVLLAIAAPMYAFEGARATLLRTVSALIGALQLALLVALGGFAPLDWGLFALIAAAGQWLAWRDERFSIVPTIGAALSAILLLMWPDPAPGWLAGIALALTAIHALPLLARLWSQPARRQRAIELCGIACAAPIVTLTHSPLPDAATNPPVALAGGLAAAVLLVAAALGWKVEDRRTESRFAWLIGTAGALAIFASLFVLPHWQVPLFAAVVTIGAVWLSRLADDTRLESIAVGFVVTAVILLTASDGEPYAEWQRLDAMGYDLPTHFALLRWSGVTLSAIALAALARRPVTRGIGEVFAAGLAYGTLAQVLPATALPLLAPLGCAGLALAATRLEWPRLRAAMLSFVAIAVLWACAPIVYWLEGAAESLVGIPMLFDRPELALPVVARQLFAPALLFGASLWLLRGRLSAQASAGGMILAAIPGLIALHCFYRAAFASAVGTDFVATGLAQRLLWDALILGLAFGLWKRAGGSLARYGAPALAGVAAFHTVWYSLLLHDPLWTAQAVGAIPLANLLLPLFAILPLCIWLAGQAIPDIAVHVDKLLQPVIMLMVALFAWATLRQGFHGTLLVDPGLGQTEDILRSILGIVLAIGYLLWGIRRHRRDWRLASLVLMLVAVAKVFLFDASGLEGLLRIASFIALGFSLIGIGWLYSRQLRREAVAKPL